MSQKRRRVNVVKNSEKQNNWRSVTNEGLVEANVVV